MKVLFQVKALNPAECGAVFLAGQGSESTKPLSVEQYTLSSQLLPFLSF